MEKFENRQKDSIIDGLERQISADFEKMALLQLDFEQFQSESKKKYQEIAEQLKEKEAEIRSFSQNSLFLTPAKTLHPSFSSNRSTTKPANSEIERNSPSILSLETKNRKKRAKTSKNSLFYNENREKTSNYAEESNTFKMLNEIIKTLDEKMKVFDEQRGFC